MQNRIRATALSRSALLGALAALPLGSCSPGSDGSAGPDAALGAQAAELRQHAAQAGVAPAATPPTVADALFELGRSLYFDPLLSGNHDVSCATCHLPVHGGGDGRTLPGGVGGSGNGPARFGGAVIPRNSPTVLNLHLAASLFWDGRVERLPDGSLRTPAGDQLTPEMTAAFTPGLEVAAAQAMFPPTSRDEMRGHPGENELADLDDDNLPAIWSALVDRLLIVPAYVDLFGAAYPGTATVDLTFAHAANAIAAFEVRAFGQLDSPFDRFLRGDDAALDAEQLAGGLEFFTAGGCARCHSGPALSDFVHRGAGLAQFGPGKGDGPLADDDFGRERVSADPAERYRFRTPSLLNVELTAPYGHVGQFATLSDFVQRYGDVRGALEAYDPALHVDDPALVDTLVDNLDALLEHLDPQLEAPRQFDAAAVEAFLRALTADGARDLSDVVPASVPSGLPVL